MEPDLKNRYGSWVLVAGAAEGLGGAFTRALAAQQMNLILVDHQKELLNTLISDLEVSFPIQVKALHLDLADQDSVDLMMDTIAEVDCRLIIYNAAFSRVQRYLDNDRQLLDRYVQVNISTPMQLVHSFCQLHQKDPDRRKGILLMASLAGCWGTQLLGPYGASKAFNQNLAESLYYELKDQGFDVLACIAGPTDTPGYRASLPRGKVRSMYVMHPRDVVRAGLIALGRKPFVVAGLRNKLIYFIMSRFFPRRISLRIMNRAVGKLYNDNL
jgi:short-subunit dehydrogenase